MGLMEDLKNRMEEVNEVKDANGETRAERKERLDNSKEVYCPKCLSTEISADKRGWKLTTGLIGRNKIMITCLKCGNKWKAGK